MAQIQTSILITDSTTTVGDVTSRFLKPGSDRQQTLLLTNYLQALNSRSRDGSYTIQVLNGDGVKATGTVTCASAANADTVTVGNVVFTAVTGTPSGNQFKVGVSNTADGLSLQTAINACAALSGVVTALNASGVVTITRSKVGLAGNALQLSSSNNTRLAVVAMSGGVEDTATTYTVHLGL